MADRLPSLNALRAFEAAARHLSFSRAAEELHVTPTAISHQIRGLEDYLGTSLFHRTNRGLVLTEAARESQARLREAFIALGEVVDRLQRPAPRPPLTLLAPPSLAATWLLPRLPRLTERHRQGDFRVSTSTRTIGNGQSPDSVLETLRDGKADLVISFSEGDYPGCRVEKLLATSVVPLCSPRLLGGEFPLHAPGNLRHHTLIHDDTAYAGRPGWSDWLLAAGVTNIDGQRGLHFNHVSLALQAARDAQGVVLSLQALAEDDLAAGHLVMPFDITLPLSQSYFLVGLDSEAHHHRVAPLWDWLLAEAA